MGVMRAMLCRGAAAARQLCQALDDMDARKAHLGDTFQLCGPQHRSTGSHDIVELVQAAGTEVWCPVAWSCDVWPFFTHVWPRAR
jgi:hypothetical protein